MIWRKLPGGVRSVAAGASALRGGCRENTETQLKSNRNAPSVDFCIATPSSTLGSRDLTRADYPSTIVRSHSDARTSRARAGSRAVRRTRRRPVANGKDGGYLPDRRGRRERAAVSLAERRVSSHRLGERRGRRGPRRRSNHGGRGGSPAHTDRSFDYDALSPRPRPRAGRARRAPFYLPVYPSPAG